MDVIVVRFSVLRGKKLQTRHGETVAHKFSLDICNPAEIRHNGIGVDIGIEKSQLSGFLGLNPQRVAGVESAGREVDLGRHREGGGV